MGTAIYGSYDELVFELSIGDRLRNGWPSATVLVHLDDLLRVRAADPADLVSWDGERVLRIGHIRRGRRVLVLELTGEAYDRVLVASDDADAFVEDLRRRGVGTRVLSAA